MRRHYGLLLALWSVLCLCHIVHAIERSQSDSSESAFVTDYIERTDQDVLSKESAEFLSTVWPLPPHVAPSTSRSKNVLRTTHGLHRYDLADLAPKQVLADQWHAHLNEVMNKLDTLLDGKPEVVGARIISSLFDIIGDLLQPSFIMSRTETLVPAIFAFNSWLRTPTDRKDSPWNDLNAALTRINEQRPLQAFPEIERTMQIYVDYIGALQTRWLAAHRIRYYDTHTDELSFTAQRLGVALSHLQILASDAGETLVANKAGWPRSLPFPARTEGLSEDYINLDRVFVGSRLYKLGPAESLRSEPEYAPQDEFEFREPDHRIDIYDFAEKMRKATPFDAFELILNDVFPLASVPKDTDITYDLVRDLAKAIIGLIMPLYELADAQSVTLRQKDYTTVYTTAEKQFCKASGRIQKCIDQILKFDRVSPVFGQQSMFVSTMVHRLPLMNVSGNRYDHRSFFAKATGTRYTTPARSTIARHAPTRSLSSPEVAALTAPSARSIFKATSIENLHF
ncbi:hypothetical protein CXG81DRAFT_19040 [Caulochytrium protostelioides]|uniref:Uncharacterized protein n=1 Tax=Caulochytrium protostelioides TaxID=1555241 RepID=A0A4P9WT82_9FUNG|nr:hypothetical protein CAUPRSCDRAFT_11861 [Caulochytrium protostelioides]RKP01127.1 hypothetical protein CXG81DRAFT_19040 [Caulochytrium protostelioides]|eukprot:RKP01127.1 hypothetical protein CXG81DRAFT_19040 [Caulochytrium protostelioides]